ncbi:hypothetical protein MKW98_023772 [Papaver atlanticum]|uniref:Uncharacterized protein n=1 Tax=Papaver atlanticum TaxID=357466 RepID=A0AAD4SZV1_9MAGN|nr:hypothetical protein MKW98_023772 [Papaver atlanticum]
MGIKINALRLFQAKNHRDFTGFRELIIDNGYTIKRLMLLRGVIFIPQNLRQLLSAVAPDDDKIDRRNLLPITIRKRRETNGVYYVAGEENQLEQWKEIKDRYWWSGEQHWQRLGPLVPSLTITLTPQTQLQFTISSTVSV